MIQDDLVGLRKLYLGFISSRVILTANNLGIFDNLGKAKFLTKILKANIIMNEHSFIMWRLLIYATVGQAQ